MNELFRTPVNIPKMANPINHTQHVLMLGSCFSENIYNKLKSYRFNCFSNPTGIVYNPISIVSTVQRLLHRNVYTKDNLIFHNGLWTSFDHHSAYSNSDPGKCIEKINGDFLLASALIERLDVLVLTFGSAFVYQLREDFRIVSNCHKLPENRFIRRLASIDEISSSCSDIFRALLKINPALNIILTVSPVRHLRDNAHENTVSKSHLISSVYALEKTFDQIYYFPAFEIMMDELRDYRFFAPDMIHPSDVAIDFIWKRFCQSCIAKKSDEFIERYSKIITARMHRLLYPDSETANAFTDAQVRCLDTLQKDFPDIVLESDYTYFNANRTT
jgi:hypothetical protein